MRRSPSGRERAFVFPMLFLFVFKAYAFDLQIPREQDMVRPRCEASFPAALSKKEEYESRVKVDCTHSLPGAEMKDLRESFTENCVATSNVRIRKMDGPGRLTIDEVLVTTMFDYAYSPIFQKMCMDRELSRFYRSRGGESAPSTTTGYSPSIHEVYTSR